MYELMLMHDPLFVACPFSSIFIRNASGVGGIFEAICICSSNEAYEISSLYQLILYKTKRQIPLFSP
jgi:hypothetical protein